MGIVDPILSEPTNCWKIVEAKRATMIIDSERYFRVLRQALRGARDSVFIIGWDIHSRLRLVRESPDDDLPAELGALLEALVQSSPNLRIYILSWDFAMIYAMEREFFPTYKLRWKSHDRVSFCLDGEHPLGASQHQKLVVIDDRLAFCGGIDLGKWRWDTSAHRVKDERRVDPDGKSYPPFHDLQMAVEGEAARALGQLARDRWRMAASKEPGEPRTDICATMRPLELEADFQDVAIGIARTMPEYGERPETREVEQLYLDSIAAAQRLVYIENQYLSSYAIGEALAKRLEDPDGPEIVVIGPETTGGWLEQHTMDVLRGRLLQNLREADRYGRLAAYCVRLSNDPRVTLMIHAKLMIIDDRFVRVGSSNLSNRSMGLDSECDLAIDAASDQGSASAIRRIRHRLLAEHLAVDPEEVAEAEAREGSTIGAIESLRGGERTVEPLSAEVPAEVDQWVPESELLDPERPISPEALLDHFVGPRERKLWAQNTIKAGALVLIVLSLAAAWRWTPLGDWLTVDGLAEAGGWLRERPLTPILVLAAYVVAGFAVVPVTLLFAATVTVFGPWLGMAYSLAGAELSALACFGAGHLLGRDAVRRLGGSRVNRISRKLSERGVLTMITLRIVPIAPFSLINVVAGVSDIRLRDFAIGNFLGMLPGVVAIAFVAESALALVRAPSATTVFVAVGVVVMAIGALVGARYLIRRRAGSS
ncbi:MAG: VTT domain-containing protein [Deltaproteobacteria bacterium]|jgi:phosphatidylserine/phosphatidylglycerophosphate/cardiolipin synthase-like enzyme/membrane protein DedA with SNARE-associated domain|nr:VTT domain-containing protein [Deltaproteobacteria bacterium]